jgi:hypothetical protein
MISTVDSLLETLLAIRREEVRAGKNQGLTGNSP